MLRRSACSILQYAARSTPEQAVLSAILHSDEKQDSSTPSTSSREPMSSLMIQSHRRRNQHALFQTSRAFTTSKLLLAEEFDFSPEKYPFLNNLEDVASGCFPLTLNDPACASSILDTFQRLETFAVLSARHDAYLTAPFAIMFFLWLFEKTGLPWYMVIMCFNLTFRFILLPLLAYSQRMGARSVANQYEMAKLGKYQAAVHNARSNIEKTFAQRALTTAQKEVEEKKGGIMKDAIVPAGLFIINAFLVWNIMHAMIKLCESKLPSLMFGGVLWFTDLTSPDPYYGLPICCMLVTLLQIEITFANGTATAQNSTIRNGMKWVARAATLMFLVFGTWMPAGSEVLWVGNSMFSVIQIKVLRSDWLRRKVGMATMAEMAEMSRKASELADVSKAMSPQKLKLLQGEMEGPDTTKEQPKLFTFDPTKAVKPKIGFAKPAVQR